MGLRDEMSVFEHFVLFYDTDQSLESELSAFIRAGLVVGDPCIVIATALHREQMEHRLQAYGINLAVAHARKQYHWLDAVSVLSKILVDGWPAPERCAAEVGRVIARAAKRGSHVRVFGELEALLIARDNRAAAMRMEELWNELHESTPQSFTILCGYALGALARGEPEDLVPVICRYHSHVLAPEHSSAWSSLADRLKVSVAAPQPESLRDIEQTDRQRAKAILRHEAASFWSRSEPGGAAADGERMRFALEAHALVTQEIFAASLLAQTLPQLWDHHRAEAEQALQHVHTLTRGALAGLRVLQVELQPVALEQMALPDLLRQLAEAMASRAGVPIAVTCEGDWPALSEQVKLAFYRVAQEALMNAANYAAARQMSLRLRRRRTGTLVLEVEDDGRGFDVRAIPSGHRGIAMMRERARAIGATLRIKSLLGKGTAVIIDWRGSRGDARRSQGGNM
jgi:signal transduction histidine kinase